MKSLPAIGRDCRFQLTGCLAGLFDIDPGTKKSTLYPMEEICR